MPGVFAFCTALKKPTWPKPTVEAPDGRKRAYIDVFRRVGVGKSVLSQGKTFTNLNAFSPWDEHCHTPWLNGRSPDGCKPGWC